MPPQSSQAMLDALKKAGGGPKPTVDTQAGHDSRTATYDDPKFYERLLARRRPDGEKTTKRD